MTINFPTRTGFSSSITRICIMYPSYVGEVSYFCGSVHEVRVLELAEPDRKRWDTLGYTWDQGELTSLLGVPSPFSVCHEYRFALGIPERGYPLCLIRGHHVSLLRRYQTALLEATLLENLDICLVTNLKIGYHIGFDESPA